MSNKIQPGDWSFLLAVLVISLLFEFALFGLVRFGADSERSECTPASVQSSEENTP